MQKRLDELRAHAPAIEIIVEDVTQEDVLPFVKRLMTLAWKERFEWSPPNTGPHTSGLFTLFQLMVAATSGDRDSTLYKYLISLRGGEAHIVMNALQLVRRRLHAPPLSGMILTGPKLLDFSVHVDSEPLARAGFLKALHRLSGASEMYPTVLEHPPIPVTSANLIQGAKGSFGQVYKGNYEGKVLALKVAHRDKVLKVRAPDLRAQTSIFEAAH